MDTNTTDGNASEIDKFTFNSEAELEKAREKMKDNTEMIERHEIKDTPFYAVREQENWYLLLGRYRLNEHPFKTREEVEKEAEEVNWHRLMQVMRIVAEDVTKEIERKAKQQITEFHKGYQEYLNQQNERIEQPRQEAENK